MDIVEYDPKRDFELYLNGDIEAFNFSFPGVSINGDLRSDIIFNLKSFEISDYKTAFTAILEGIPIGFVFIEMSGFFTIPQGYISSIYVEKAHRKKGVSSRLIEKAEKWAKEKGAFSITLDVSLVNEGAIGVYESIGFMETRVQMEKKL